MTIVWRREAVEGCKIGGAMGPSTIERNGFMSEDLFVLPNKRPP